MSDLLFYGRGVPRYLALWLPLFPLLLVALRLGRVRRDAVIVVALSTVPTFFLHNPPYAVPVALRWAALVGVLGVVAAWLRARLLSPGAPARAGTAGSAALAEGERAPDPPTGVPAQDGSATAGAWVLLALVALLALALRAPLAWADPGISDFATATEVAAQHLLEGRNPWTLPNRNATVGVYQYPVATALLSLPFVALAPPVVLGEEHIGARAAVWATDVVAVLLLGGFLIRAGHRRLGLALALAYAVHPTLVRESGIVVANDLMLALAAAGAAIALARERVVAAGLLVGLAISIKPAAAVLLPLLLLAAGWRPALAAVGLPAAAQLPFLLFPKPGLWGVWAIVEPVSRRDPPVVLELSSWWPAYALVGDSDTLLRVLGLVAVLVGFAVAAWAGRALRHGPRDLGRTTAAFGLALLVPFMLATVQRTNYQDWYLPALLLCAAATALEPARPRPAPAAPR